MGEGAPLLPDANNWSDSLILETSGWNFETLMDYFPQIRYAETSSFLKNGFLKAFQFILIES